MGLSGSGIRAPRLRLGVVALLGVASFWAYGTAGAWASTVTFEYTGGEQTFTVPAGVTKVHMVAAGGAGGLAWRGQNLTFGATVTADLPVTPGQVLYVEVAGGGKNAQRSAIPGGADGFNGGANAGWGYDATASGGGGGASDVRTSPRSAAGSLASRLLVAGGGGGSATCALGGDAGLAGGTCLLSPPGATSGGAGTLTAGGSGGLGYSDAEAGSPGALGLGGAGGQGTVNMRFAGDGGGGGGGGYFGGGGGGGSGGDSFSPPPWEGSGGGGSSFVTPTAGNAVISHPTNKTNIRQVSGEVAITTPSAGGGGVPTVSSARLSSATFRAAAKGASLTRKRPIGTTVSYRASQASTTTFKVLRSTTGHKNGRRCVAGRPHKHQVRCTRYASVGSFSHQDKAGKVSVHFTGRVRSRKLKPGSYRLTLTPKANGKTGRTVTLAFRIVG